MFQVKSRIRHAVAKSTLNKDSHMRIKGWWLVKIPSLENRGSVGDFKTLGKI
jgi:hypothetical protein